MSDRITTIETKISDLIKTIVKPTTPVSGVYNYYTTCGTCNIEDEVLSLAVNATDKLVNYVIYLEEPEINNEWSIGQSAYTNTLNFRINARVHNVGSESNPKFDINQKMNEVISDFKYLFGANHTLVGTCNYARYLRSTRNVDASNNRILAGNIDIYVTVNYSQSLGNPNLGACL